MNMAHWHLVLNHVPIFLTFFGLILFVTGLLSKEGKRLKVISLVMFILAGAVILPVYYTGHEAEEIVEEKPAVSEMMLEQHEELAEITRGVLIGLGLVSLIALGWMYRNGELPVWLYGVVLGASLIGCGYLGYTAYLGGQARHPEIRSTSKNQSNRIYEEKESMEHEEVEH